MITVRNGLAVTVWDSKGLAVGVQKSMEALLQIRPDIVQLHTSPTERTREPMGKVLAALPGTRIWVGLPADHLVKNASQAARLVKRYVRHTVSLGGEMFVFNGEKAWKTAVRVERAKMDELARVCIEAAREEAPELALGWTSFDHLGWHHLPWNVILGENGVDYHLPQNYTAVHPRISTHKAVAARVKTARANSLRVPGVLPCFQQGGDRCIPYGQAHHHSPDAICYLSNQSSLVAYWALSSRSDDLGVAGMWAAQALRRLESSSPGHLEDFQRKHGLKADGIVGRNTMDKINQLLQQAT